MCLKVPGPLDKGFHWVGVPVIMDASHYNKFIQPNQHEIKPTYKKKNKDKLKAVEMHRQEFQDAINYVNLETEHNGKEAFPYDALDLALYLHFLYSLYEKKIAKYLELDCNKKIEKENQ